LKEDRADIVLAGVMVVKAIMELAGSTA